MKTVIEMAREAGAHPSHNPDLYDIWSISDKALERFAELVRADEQNKWQDQTAVEIHEAILDEREACKKAADDQWVRDPNVSGGDAIRARGEKT